MTAGRREAMVLILGAALVGPSLRARSVAGAEPGQIDGFRSAKFGGDEKAVRAAIKTDFGLGEAAIRAEVNPLEKTTALLIEVPELDPGGKAQIVYILGYVTQRLIQVNLVWGAPVDPAATAGRLAGAAILLRNYFAEQPFPPDRRQQDQRLADGSVLYFQGMDPQGRQVILLLQSAAVPAAGETPEAVHSLRLSYIADPRTPDVYRLKAGSF